MVYYYSLIHLTAFLYGERKQRPEKRTLKNRKRIKNSSKNLPMRIAMVGKKSFLSRARAGE